MQKLKKTVYNLSCGCILLFFLLTINSFAQAPVISYSSPQTYTVNTSITPLLPSNTGGAVIGGYSNVSTFAGSGTRASTDGTGTAASFNQPEFMAKYPTGIFVPDYSAKVIRKINPAGVVSTFAGNGQFGTVDGPGNVASFTGPTGITIDSHGNLFVSEYQANIIRKITPGGVVSTFAGSGATGKADGTGTAASFNWPYGIATDANDNIYVAEAHNYLIRKITPAGVVTTFAGDGTLGANDGPALTAQFRGPTAVATDAAGNVYVSDGGNNSIRKINTSGIVSTLAGIGGPAALSGSNLSFVPWGLRADNSGNVYFTATNKNQIIKITPQNTFSIIAGSPAGTSGSANGSTSVATFSQPRDLVFDAAGNMYVADNINNLIRKIDYGGYAIDKPLPAGLVFDTTTGTISGTPTVISPATNYTITASNGSGSSSTIVNIQVLANAPTTVIPPNISYQTPQIYKTNTPIPALTPTNTGGTVPATIYGRLTNVYNGFNIPTSVAVDGNGNIFVADWTNNQIKKIDNAGVISVFAGSGASGFVDGQGPAASFYEPDGITIDASGNLYVGDENNHLIRKITPTGLVSTLAGSGGVSGSANGTGTAATFYYPRGLAIDATGNTFVADQGNNMIRKITPAGVVTTYSGSITPGFNNGSINSATYNTPTGVGFDVTGNLYVADAGNNAIRKITAGGVVSTFATGLNFPREVKADATNNFYVTNQNGNSVSKISPTGIVTPLIITNSSGTIIPLNGPIGLTLDGQGNLYIADAGANSVKKITITGYTIDKTLPAGLVFDPTTGIISGTPTTVSPAQDYTVTAYNGGGSSSTIINITVSTLSQAVITFPQPIVSSANSNNDITPAATSTNTQTPITYSSDNPAVAVITNGLIHIVGPGVAHITASQVGNANFIAATPVTVTLTVTQQEVITFAPITTKTSCDIDFSAGATSNVSSFQIIYISSNTAVATVSAQGVIHIIASGTTTITASQTGDNIYLSAQPVSQLLTVAALPTLPSVTISASTNNIYAGVPVTFTATVANAGTVTYQWQLNGSNTGTNSAAYNSSTLKNGDVVTCIITSNIPCTVPVTSAAVIINIIPATTINIPNTFTPNGDGINDRWDIPELVNYPNCLMSIYNRYGSLVFQSKGYTISWDGLFRNNQLPSSTYYYILNLGQGIPNGKLNGYISILR